MTLHDFTQLSAEVQLAHVYNQCTHISRSWDDVHQAVLPYRVPAGFSVVLFPEAADLLVRHRGHLPVRLNSNGNDYFKEVAAELKLSLPDLTFKDARSTFSQYWRDRRVSSDVIAAMMGNTERMVNKEYRQRARGHGGVGDGRPPGAADARRGVGKSIE